MEIENRFVSFRHWLLFLGDWYKIGEWQPLYTTHNTNTTRREIPRQLPESPDGRQVRGEILQRKEEGGQGQFLRLRQSDLEAQGESCPK